MGHASASGCCGRQAETPRRETSSALEILMERFARGEIDKAEFEEKRQVLSEPQEAASAAGDRKGCC